ncbi:MAG: DUF4339 domain-containing protein [Verrucomicrobia bacterium]|nr:DUF4339 domain-containing protein [Verrucomicrobiota bacterium]
MDDDAELPEYQIFSILRQGEEEPIGPYSQNQIVRLLNEEVIRPFDLVYYEDLGTWKPIRDVFEIHEGISNFVDEGQDKLVVGEVFRAVQQLFGAQEEVYYIAIQEKGPIHLGPITAVALTASRLLIASHRAGKLEMEAHLWPGVANARLIRKPGQPLGAFHVDLHSGTSLQVERIPQVQLERLEQVANDIRTAGH